MLKLRLTEKAHQLKLTLRKCSSKLRYIFYDLKLIYCCFRQIENFTFEIKNSEFFANTVELLKQELGQQEIKEIICLGIGRISSCYIAKYQLSFISAIKEFFGVSNIKFFDPVLSSGEKQLLETLRYEVLTENTEGKYSVQHPTVFYLPHCPKQITNNLLFSNWNPDNIRNLILICNSFKSVIEKTPERFLRPNAHYILEINPYVNESEIENNFRFSDIFNDFSLHTFPSDKLSIAPASVWENHIQPSYAEEDLELIPNGRS